VPQVRAPIQTVDFTKPSSRGANLGQSPVPDARCPVPQVRAPIQTVDFTKPSSRGANLGHSEPTRPPNREPFTARIGGV
jgi:hypothetical protein